MTPEADSCVRPTETGCELAVQVTPRAKKTEVCGVRNHRIAIRLNAPPVDGKANRELVRLLRELFRVPKSGITIVAGETSRVKTVQIAGIAPGEASQRLSLTP